MKKILFCIILSSSLIACTNSTTKESSIADKQSSTVEHIYKPTYTDNFKIGDQKNVLLVEQFHQAVFAKDYKQLGDLLVDTVSFNMEDGSNLKGKAAVLEFVEKNFTSLNFKNYKLNVIVPMVGENGHQLVAVWDEVDVETPDGKIQKTLGMDAFRFENGKIVSFNGFAKYPK